MVEIVASGDITELASQQDGPITPQTSQTPRIGFRPTIVQTGSVLETVLDNGSEPCIRAFVVGNMSCGNINHYKQSHLLMARYIIQAGDFSIRTPENALRIAYAHQVVDIINLAPLAYMADQNFVSEVPECHIAIDDEGVVRSTICNTTVTQGQSILRMPVPATTFQGYSFYERLGRNHPERSRERVGLYAVGDMTALMRTSMFWTDREYTEVLLGLLTGFKNSPVDNYRFPTSTDMIRR